jgi:hypothetical protein
MADVRRWMIGIGASLAMGLLAGVRLDAAVAGADPRRRCAAADRDLLAGLAAVAKDKRYVATYTLTAPDRPNRTVTVAFATDGTWVVAIPAGALSGLADVAMYGSPAGLFQCVLGPAAGTVGARPDLGPLTPTCAALPSLTAATDPRVQHVFTDWIDPLVDRATALSVAPRPRCPTPRAAVTRWSRIRPRWLHRLDPGVYCYSAEGLLTAAKVGFGSLAPSRVRSPRLHRASPMPAPTVDRAPVPVTAPAPPHHPLPHPAPDQP